MNSIIVTGGCGFIGTNLTRHLTEKGYDVRVVDDLSTGQKTNLDGVGVSCSTADVRSKGLESVMKGVEVVAHLAAIASVPHSEVYPVATWDVNVNGTLNLLELCRVCKVRRFIFISSSAVHGHSIYGASKLAGEALCDSYNVTYGLQTVCLRLSNVYGDYSGNKGVIPIFLNLIKEGKPLTIYGNGHQARDFVYVGDVCRVIEIALEHGNGVYEIGTGVATRLHKLVEILESITKKNVVTRHERFRKRDILYSAADICKAREILGYEPSVDLRTGLKMQWEKICSG